MAEIQSNDGFYEVMDALYNLRRAFLKNGMPAPLSIELADDSSINWWRYNLPPEFAVAQPRMGDEKKDAEWVCNIMGIEVRMKAQWRRDRDGLSRLV